MIRRGFLGLLASAPLVAAGGLQQASSLGAMGMNQAADPVCVEPPFWRKLFQKEKATQEKRRYANERHSENMHHNIRSKKSWSPAFKAHVQGQYDIANRESWDFSDDEALQWLMDRGFGHLLKDS